MRQSLRRLGWALVVTLAVACSGTVQPRPSPRASASLAPEPEGSTEPPDEPAPPAPVVEGDPPEPEWSPSSTWEEPYAVAQLGKDCHWQPPQTFEGGQTHFLHCDNGGWGGTPDDPCVGEVVNTCGPACFKSCRQCPTACVDACDECKGACKDDACRRKCGQGCASCRKKCMDEFRACNGQCSDSWNACRDKALEAWNKGPCPKLCPRMVACVDACPATDGSWECSDKCQKKVMPRCTWAPTRCGTF